MGHVGSNGFSQSGHNASLITNKNIKQIPDSY